MCKLIFMLKKLQYAFCTIPLHIYMILEIEDLKKASMKNHTFKPQNH